MIRQRSLRKRAEFNAALESGVRTRRDGLTLIVASRPGSTGRLGLAVRASSAPARNRLKRRLRAAFTESGIAGVDVVARADESATSMDYQEMVLLFRSAGGTG